MAFLGPSSTVEGPTLYVGRPDSWALARVGVSSFRWHATVSGRIGWLEPGDPPRLCWADADAAEGLSAAVCVPGTGSQLVGFDSSGFLVVDYASRTVTRLDATGRQVRSLPGTNALMAYPPFLRSSPGKASCACPSRTDMRRLPWGRALETRRLQGCRPARTGPSARCRVSDRTSPRPVGVTSP